MREVEYVAVTTGMCQAVWLRRLLEEITGEEQATHPTLVVDNQPAIMLAKNPVLHNQSKHIYVKFHEGKIAIEFVELGRQLADILTKSLGRLRFTGLRKMIGMVDI
jgi:hypothetical protein